MGRITETNYNGRHVEQRYRVNDYITWISDQSCTTVEPFSTMIQSRPVNKWRIYIYIHPRVCWSKYEVWDNGSIHEATQASQRAGKSKIPCLCGGVATITLYAWIVPNISFRLRVSHKAILHFKMIARTHHQRHCSARKWFFCSRCCHSRPINSELHDVWCKFRTVTA